MSEDEVMAYRSMIGVMTEWLRRNVVEDGDPDGLEAAVGLAIEVSLPNMPVPAGGIAIVIALPEPHRLRDLLLPELYPALAGLPERSSPPFGIFRTIPGPAAMVAAAAKLDEIVENAERTTGVRWRGDPDTEMAAPLIAAVIAAHTPSAKPKFVRHLGTLAAMAVLKRIETAYGWTWNHVEHSHSRYGCVPLGGLLQGRDVAALLDPLPMFDALPRQ